MTTKALIYTGPENRGECGFCHGEEGGYAKRDSEGNWQAACWPCVKPESSGTTLQKRAVVGTVFTDTNATDDKPETRKSRGVAPSSHRPKTN